MRISEDYNFIFISRSQCASTTIRNVLDPYSDWKSTKRGLIKARNKKIITENYMKGIFGYKGKPKLMDCRPHIKAPQLKKTMNDSGLDWENFHSFTSVRNPWDRMVSRYEYGHKNEKSTYNKHVSNSDNFDEFLFSLHEATEATFEDAAFDSRGNYLFDDIIKVENLEDDLNRITKKIGIVSVHIPHKNENPRRKSITEYYSESSKEFVREEYSFEI